MREISACELFGWGAFRNDLFQERKDEVAEMNKKRIQDKKTLEAEFHALGSSESSSFVEMFSSRPRHQNFDQPPYSTNLQKWHNSFCFCRWKDEKINEFSCSSWKSDCSLYISNAKLVQKILSTRRCVIGAIVVLNNSNWTRKHSHARYTSNGDPSKIYSCDQKGYYWQIILQTSSEVSCMKALDWHSNSLNIPSLSHLRLQYRQLCLNFPVDTSYFFQIWSITNSTSLELNTW